MSRVRTLTAALMSALALAVSGCGDDEKESPQAKCETLVDSFCEAVTTCAEDADLLADDYPARELLRDCKQTVGKGAHCEDAAQVSKNYERCLSAASERLDCDESNDSLLLEDTFAIPAQCEGVILY